MPSPPEEIEVSRPDKLLWPSGDITKRRYVGYLDGDDGDVAVRAAYGANYERLAEIKQKYDPGNTFHINQNIQPASEPGS